MFVWNKNDPNKLYLRSNVDRRYNGNLPSPYTAYSNPPSWVAWNSILSTVEASVEDQNLHPYTQGFRSPNQIVHVRQGQNNNLIVNMYGGSPLTTSSWNMLAQTSLPVAAVSGITTWVSMTSPSFNTGIYLLVGRVTVESGTVFPRHLAIQASTELGVPTSTPVTLFWDVTGSDGNTAWREGDSVIGQYSQDSPDLGLVKYFLYNGGPPYKYKLEVWTMPKDMSTTPVLAQTWTTGAINHILNLRYPFFNSPDIMIACGYDNQTATNAWYFATFTNGYKNPIVTTFLDLSVSYPAQAVLAASLDTAPLPQVVRISYGPTYPTPNTIQIDILSINGPAVKLVKTQTFPITWGSLPTTSYLSWNLTTVYFSLYRDLVAYVSDTTNTAPMLIIFPGISGPGFGPPQVVNLSVPAANTSFFSADFMNPVFTRGVTVFNPLISRLRQAGFVSFFDNLGILGVRAVGSNGTTANPYSIGILGQTPAIAGQSSAGLGPRPVDVMGNNAPAEALGFAMVQNN
ncbi:hypothetical protein B0O99DRAFT_643049 [Bisporella sp. PMI_857]|nr:hypothetical protein B0O99DRAFT_643049 [Bisporella sp. PMI_857]